MIIPGTPGGRWGPLVARNQQGNGEVCVAEANPTEARASASSNTSNTPGFNSLQTALQKRGTLHRSRNRGRPSRPCGHQRRSAERSPRLCHLGRASGPPGRRSAGTRASAADLAAPSPAAALPRFAIFASASTSHKAVSFCHLQHYAPARGTMRPGVRRSRPP